MDNGQASSLSLSLEQTGPGSRGTRHGDDRNDAFHKFCSSSYPRRRVEITKEELESVKNLSFREAALKLGVSRTTIQRLRRKYKIPLGPVSIHFAKLSTFGSVLDAPLAQTRALAIHVLTARPYFWFLHETPPQIQRRSKKGRINLENLVELFHFPSREVCERLQVSRTTLLRRCREFGIKEWPYLPDRSPQEYQAIKKMFEVAGNDEDDCLEDTLKEDIEIEKPAVAQTTDRGDPVVLDANTVTSSGRKDSLPPFLASSTSSSMDFGEQAKVKEQAKVSGDVEGGIGRVLELNDVLLDILRPARKARFADRQEEFEMMSKWCEAQEDKVLFDMAPAIFECLQLSVTEADKKLAHKDMGKYVIALQHAAKRLRSPDYIGKAKAEWDRFSTGQEALDVYIPVLVNGFGCPDPAKLLLDAYTHSYQNVYNNSFCMAAWLVGLGYPCPQSPTQIFARVKDVQRQIEEVSVNAMEAFRELLDWHGLPPPPHPFHVPLYAHPGDTRRPKTKLEMIFEKRDFSSRSATSMTESEQGYFEFLMKVEACISFSMHLKSYRENAMMDHITSAVMLYRKMSSTALFETQDELAAELRSNGNDWMDGLDTMTLRTYTKLVEEVRLRVHCLGTKVKPASISNTVYEPYVPLLSCAMVPSTARQILTWHQTCIRNLYDDPYILALWLMGLGYKAKPAPVTLWGGPKEEPARAIEREIRNESINGIAVFMSLVKENDVQMLYHHFRKASFPEQD